MENSIRSSQIVNNHVVEQLRDENGQLKRELSEQISYVARELNNKLEDIHSDLLSEFRNKQKLDRSFLSVLLFIQNLDKYLDDKTLDKGFVDKVRQDIRRILKMYGYKIVDYNEMVDDVSKHYDIDFDIINSEFTPGYELVSRAVVDNEDNTIIKGKVYIKRSI